MYMMDQEKKERKRLAWDMKQKSWHILKCFLWAEHFLYLLKFLEFGLFCTLFADTISLSGLVLDKIDFAEQRESSVSIKARALWSSAQNIKHGQFQSAWSPTVSYLNAQFFHLISRAFGLRLLRTADICSTPGHKPMSNIWLQAMFADQSVLVNKGWDNLSIINKVKIFRPHQVFNPDAR